MIISATQTRQESIRIRDSTELAVFRRAFRGVGEIAASVGNVWFEIRAAVHSLGRVEVQEFDVGAYNLGVGEADGEHTVD